MDTRQVIVTGVVLGVTAALVVWFLERFETTRIADRLAGEAGQYLERWDDFQEYLRQHPPGRGS